MHLPLVVAGVAKPPHLLIACVADVGWRQVAVQGGMPFGRYGGEFLGQRLAWTRGGFRLSRGAAPARGAPVTAARSTVDASLPPVFTRTAKPADLFLAAGCGSPEIVEGFLSRFGLRLVFPDLIVDG